MESMRPPEPPARFTAAEKAIWHETIASVRPNWFAGSLGPLASYCTATAFERRLAEWLKQLDDPNGPRYPGLVRMHATEAKLAAGMATKLRLTTRSTVLPLT